MRCLTLADELKQRGAQIRFVSRELPAHLRDMLAAKGIAFTLLPSSTNPSLADNLAHSHWLGTSQAQDAADTLHALANQTWDWLIVDHYALDSRWESALRPVVKNILVIDDLADRQHDCDMLLDQNFYADMQIRYRDKVPAHCQLLLGSRYALLREEFRQLHDQVKPRTGPVKRVLIFFGGIDITNYTASAIQALLGIDNADFQVDVVIGAQHPHREQIIALCADHAFTCHVQTSRMAELMATADLVIGAGGSATWERCCLGVPTLAFYTADNQYHQVLDAASAGLLVAPEQTGELIAVMRRHLRALIENSSLRQLISHNSMSAVDGKGVLRILGELGCSSIEIREANLEDTEKLFEWRNHPSIRAVSRNTDIIDWEIHQKWFASVLAASDRLLLIGQREDVPVGVVRFDIQRDEAEVSIYLVPDAAKQSGLGRELLQSAERWLKVNRPNVAKLCAHVLGANESSQRLFLGVGYRVESTCYSKRLHV